MHGTLAAAVRRSLKPLLVEWCCAEDSVLSAEFEKLGGETWRLGLPDWDLSDPKVVKFVIETLQDCVRHGQQIFLWLTLPCTCWCTWHFVTEAVHGPMQDLERQREESSKMLNLVIVALEKLLGPLVHAAFEWPRMSLGWKTLQQITRLCGLLSLRCDFDGCCFKIKDKKGRLLKNPWRVQTDLTALQKPLSQRCSQDHFHGECRGEAALASAFYSENFARTVAPFLFQPIHDAFPANWEFPEEDDEAMDDDFGQEEESEQQQQQANENNLDDQMQQQQSDQNRRGGTRLRAKLSPDEVVLQNAIRHLHRNLGHPEARALARAIRLSGGSDAAVKAALAFRCPVCYRLQDPRPTAAAKIRQWKRFGDAVAVDLFQLADCKGHTRDFLNMLDMASTYQLVALLRDKSARQSWDVFMQTWVTPLGVPACVISDQGGEFQKEFADGLESLGTRVCTTAAWSPPAKCSLRASRRRVEVACPCCDR